jgi:hypothetical protein
VVGTDRRMPRPVCPALFEAGLALLEELPTPPGRVVLGGAHAGEGAEQNQPAHPFGYAGGQGHRRRSRPAAAEHHRAGGSGVVQHRCDVVGALLRADGVSTL